MSNQDTEEVENVGQEEGEETVVVDETEGDDTVLPVRYEITSFGADYDVDGLVRRLKEKEILIPSFQRSFIWTQAQGSRFIESLLLGLPVPGIFLTKDSATSKLNVIDGQQRLKTLQFFFEGFFNPKANEKNLKVFTLEKVQSQFEGKTYETLSEQQRIDLKNSIIHATVVKQDSPADDDTSIFHLFERLNTKQTNLVPQEIRAALFGGPFDTMIKLLNENKAWREIYGKPSPKLKDRELILRFFALFYEQDSYVKPMAEFLTKFMKKNSKVKDPHFLESLRVLFVGTIEIIHQALGSRAFRLQAGINAAVFDSVMVGVAHRLQSESEADPKKLASKYAQLLGDSTFMANVISATSDEKSVQSRLDLSTEAFRTI